MEAEAAQTTEPEATPEVTEQAENKKSFSLLAAEMFGDQYVGDEPAEAPEPEPQPEAPSAEEEGPEAEAPAEEVSEEDEVPITSFRELIEANQYDPEWANSLRVPVKIDGSEKEVSISDLVNSYQPQEAAVKRLDEAKARAKSINEELASKSEKLEGQFAVTAKLIESMESALTQSQEGVDWDALRQEDPAEYAARIADADKQRARIQAWKDEALSAYQKYVQETQSEHQQATQETLLKEQEALLEKLPEWRNPEKATAEKTALSEYLLSQGFSEQDVAGASDHRLIVLSRKAMLYDEMQKKTDAARKKVRAVPKVLKPGAPKSNETRSREKAEKLRQKAMKDGSVDAAFAYLRAKRGG